MTTFEIKSNQKPSNETLQRLSDLKDEDIVYDYDSPSYDYETLKKMYENTKKKNKFFPVLR